MTTSGATPTVWWTWRRGFCERTGGVQIHGEGYVEGIP
jgi:hypothetical protein